MTKGTIVHGMRQNFWVLASIQAGSNGIMGMVFGWKIAKEHGPSVAIGSICVGNLILWLIGMAIISMAKHDRSNAIGNIKHILGKWSSFFAAFCLIIAFLSWYVFQLKTATVAIDSFFQSFFQNIKGDILLRSGAALGLLGSLFALGGIRIIKWINATVLLILIVYHLYALIISENNVVLLGDWKLSFSAITSVVLFFLVGMINLPTFFRYSRSPADSYLALTLIVILMSFFQISSIWMSCSNTLVPHYNLFISWGIFGIFSGVFFLVLVVLANLLVNIYFASACWESITSRFKGVKEYAIIGLIGTSAYIFIQISSPMRFIVDLMNYFLANLSFVLLITFLLEMVFKRKSKNLIRIVGSASWLISCITAVIMEVNKPYRESHTLAVSLGIGALFFLSVIFIESTIWSIKQLWQIKKSSK